MIAEMEETMRSVSPWLIAFLLGGCHGVHGMQDPLAGADGVRDWANRASAVGVWTRVHDIVGAGDARDPFPDPACPRIEDNGDTIAIVGGCTAHDGQHWVGSAVITPISDRDEDIRIEAFGHGEDLDAVSRMDGSVEIRAAMSETSHAFALDLVREAPFEGRMEIRYDGVVEGGWVGRTVWNGAGTVTLEGRRVEASTVDQVWDPAVCRGAPASGQTTLVSARHTATVTYDGASDCDEAKAAPWTLDGVEMGRVEGISCSASPTRHRSFIAMSGWLALAWVVRRRRRSRAG